MTPRRRRDRAADCAVRPPTSPSLGARRAQGIKIGREVRADYKLVAKAYMRIGNAYKRQGLLAEAIKAFEDSLMEDRTEEVQKLLKQARA